MTIYSNAQLTVRHDNLFKGTAHGGSWQFIQMHSSWCVMTIYSNAQLMVHHDNLFSAQLAVRHDNLFKCTARGASWQSIQMHSLRCDMTGHLIAQLLHQHIAIHISTWLSTSAHGYPHQNMAIHISTWLSTPKQAVCYDRSYKCTAHGASWQVIQMHSSWCVMAGHINAQLVVRHERPYKCTARGAL